MAVREARESDIGHCQVANVEKKKKETIFSFSFGQKRFVLAHTGKFFILEAIETCAFCNDVSKSYRMFQ